MNLNIFLLFLFAQHMYLLSFDQYTIFFLLLGSLTTKVGNSWFLIGVQAKGAPREELFLAPDVSMRVTDQLIWIKDNTANPTCPPIPVIPQPLN